MTKILMIVLALLLSGCWQSDMDIAKIDYLCSDKGGVYQYYAAQGLGDAVCNNGYSIYQYQVRELILPIEELK